MSRLTVEDVNSVNFEPINEFYELDTTLIGTTGFIGVNYDFVHVNHIINGTDHTFVFEIHNSLWCGGYYILDSDRNYIDSSEAEYDSESNY